jgi:hypothetical protein
MARNPGHSLCMISSIWNMKVRVLVYHHRGRGKKTTTRTFTPLVLPKKAICLDNLPHLVDPPFSPSLFSSSVFPGTERQPRMLCGYALVVTQCTTRSGRMVRDSLVIMAHLYAWRRTPRTAAHRAVGDAPQPSTPASVAAGCLAAHGGAAAGLDTSSRGDCGGSGGGSNHTECARGCKVRSRGRR